MDSKFILASNNERNFVWNCQSISILKKFENKNFESVFSIFFLFVTFKSLEICRDLLGFCMKFLKICFCICHQTYWNYFLYKDFFFGKLSVNGYKDLTLARESHSISGISPRFEFLKYRKVADRRTRYQNLKKYRKYCRCL